MKQLIKLIILLLGAGLSIVSCKKDPAVTSSQINNPNRPPVAHAGADQVITLPLDSTELRGSGTDQDDNIVSYNWRKINGPLSFTIINSNVADTKVKNLLEGVYDIELLVTDKGGLVSKDSIRIIVQPIQGAECPSNRAIINAQLIQVGTLSQARAYVAVASSGNKIVFAGGFIGSGPTARIDIYDIVTQQWSTAELSEARWNIAAVAAGNKIFFAGGYIGIFGNILSSRVDIYDVVSNTWATAELSQPRASLAASAAGNKVLFAGGFHETFRAPNDAEYYLFTDRVDIYDLASSSWSTALLSEARGDLTASVIDSKIYFTGGINVNNLTTFRTSTRIDIYNAVSDSWSTTELSEGKGSHAGIVVGNKIYSAGGLTNNQISSNLIEIKDVNTNTSSYSCLFQSNYYKHFNSYVAAQKDNKIVFFAGGGVVKNAFDVYDVGSNSWAIAVLPQYIKVASIISLNNTIYVAGAFVNNSFSNNVWKLEF